MKKIILGIFLVLSIFSYGLEKLTFSTLNWEPFYAEKLPENGFFVAIAREAYKRAGYDIEVKFVPWARAIEDGKKGAKDGVMGAYHNDERAQYFYYSDVVAVNDEVFVQKKGSGHVFNTFDDLKGLKIGTIRGSAQATELEKKGLKVELTVETHQNILKLDQGRLDLIVIGKKFLNNYLTYSAPRLDGNFEILPKPFKAFNLYVIISKKKPNGAKIIEKFNKALAEMKADGTYDEILERFGQN